MALAAMQPKQITIYLPSAADVKRWKTLAKSKSSPLSAWVVETVENSLNRPPPKPTTDSEEVSKLRKENADLRLEIEQIKRLNYSLRTTQAANAYLASQEALTLEQQVKAALQKGGIWDGKKLGKELGIDLNDFQKLNKLLRRLIDEGKIEEVVGGFRWKS